MLVIRLHPSLSKVYHRKVAKLEIAVNDDSIRTEAGEALRSLIDRIVLTPDSSAPNGINADLQGDLAGVLQLTETDSLKNKTPGH